MDYISKKKAIQAIADCTTMRDRQQIEDLCRRSESEAHGWIGGLRDAMNALDDVQAEVWPLCVEAQEISVEDFTGADDHGQIPAYAVSFVYDDTRKKGVWREEWTIISRSNLLDAGIHYFTCRPTILQKQKASAPEIARAIEQRLRQ